MNQNLTVIYTWDNSKANPQHPLGSGVLNVVGAASVESAMQSARDYHIGAVWNQYPRPEIKVCAVIGETGMLLYQEHYGYIREGLSEGHYLPQYNTSM